MRIWKIWLRWVAVLTLALIAASAGFSRLMKGTAARRYLLAHLEASFGRPVDVGRFNFSLLNGAQLEADSVTVAEDPQFGNDYFLRAESLTAGLRWSALLAGHIEFGSVNLTRPSLNLVRDKQGRWNIEQWLPPVASAQTAGGSGARPFARGLSPERLDEIDIDGGRINFKQGDDKSEFALQDVSGSAEQESPGRWRLDLEAAPMRVGVELQEIGTLRLRGNIGGASARLQPADLNLTWRDVSLADALRLANHFDYGMRGTMDVDLNARIAPAAASPEKTSTDGDASASPSGGNTTASTPAKAQWNVSGVARLQGIHGWRLPPRDADPAANVSVEADWKMGEPQVTFSKLLVETANSQVQASGDVEWSRGFNPSLRIESSTLGFADMASFFSAMRPGVTQDLNVQGTLGVEVTLSGWPLQLKQASISSTGGVLMASSLPLLRIGPMSASMSRGALNFAPTTIAFAPVAARKTGSGTASVANAATIAQPAALSVRGAILPDASGAYHWPPLWNLSVEGAAPRVQDWTLLAQALGQPIGQLLTNTSTAGWSVAGAISLSLRGVRGAYGTPAVWSGSLDTHSIIAILPFLNQPLRLTAAHAEFSPSQVTLALSAAQAFGATWHGGIGRKTAGTPWTFDLSADALDVADLDRWLGPRARSGLLAALGFSLGADSDPQIQARDFAVAGLAARGRLRVGEIELLPLRLENFDGDVEVASRNIVVHKAQAGFFGGAVNGSFAAQLVADPTYRFQGNFDRVDLAQLGHAVPSLNSRFSGIASATLDLAAHGVGRTNLIASLEGAGQLEARNAELRGVEFSPETPAPAAMLGALPFVFRSAKGSFRIKNGAVDAVNFMLADASRRFQAQGRIDFSQLLTFQIRPLKPSVKSPASLPPEGFVLAGTVEDPRLTVSGAARPAAQTVSDSGSVRR